MPNISASDYTTFIKLQAASLGYQNGAIPANRHNNVQVVPSQSILNAQLLASKASYLVTPNNSTLNGLSYVRPYAGKGNVNNPKSLSTVSYAGSGTTSSSKTYQAGGPPSGKGNTGKVLTLYNGRS